MVILQLLDNNCHSCNINNYARYRIGSVQDITIIQDNEIIQTYTALLKNDVNDGGKNNQILFDSFNFDNDSHLWNWIIQETDNKYDQNVPSFTSFI